MLWFLLPLLVLPGLGGIEFGFSETPPLSQTTTTTTNRRLFLRVNDTETLTAKEFELHYL